MWVGPERKKKIVIVLKQTHCSYAATHRECSLAGPSQICFLVFKTSHALLPAPTYQLQAESEKRFMQVNAPSSLDLLHFATLDCLHRSGLLLLRVARSLNQ